MALPVAEITEQPNEPAAIQPGFLASARKRALPGVSFTLNPAGVCDIINYLISGQMSAILSIEAAAGSLAKVPVRMWLDGTFPTTESGMPCYDGAMLEISSSEDLFNCRLISTDGLAHQVNIQFFSNL